mgnify:CR=1 FL=1
MPPVKFHKDQRKAKDPKKTLLRLLSYLKQYTPTLIIVILCIFATAFAQITGSTALGNLVDPPATMLNAAGDYVARFIVYRFVDGKDWLQKALAKKDA